MMIPPFNKLALLIQALIVVGCCCLIAIMLVDRDATTNFVSIVTLVLVLLDKITKNSTGSTNRKEQ